MLEPVKRTNFDTTKARINYKNRILSVGKQDKKREGSQSPKRVVESLQSSPTRINEELVIPQSAKTIRKNGSQKLSILQLDLSRNNSNKTNKSTINKQKKADIISPNHSTLFGGNHRKSQTMFTLNIPNLKSQKQMKFNDYFFNQNSPAIITQNPSHLFQTEQNFFSSKNSSAYVQTNNRSIETPFLAFGNATQGITATDYGQRSLYQNMPRTAGAAGSRRDNLTQPNIPSKVTQTYLDQYIQKAQFINSAENKVYNIFEQNGKKENQSMTQSMIIPFQRGNSGKITQIDSFYPHTLSTSQPETFFFSSHNFYYFIVHTKAKQSPLKLSVKIKSPTEGYQNRLKGFISKTANRPNTFNSDDEFDGRSYKLYADGGKKMFNIDTVYVSLYPEIDMTVKIKIGFGEQKIQMNEAYILYKKQKQKAQEEYNLILLQKQRDREQKVQESMINSQNNMADFMTPFSSPAQSSMNLTMQNKASMQLIKERGLLRSCDAKKRRNITLYNKINMPNMFDKYEKLSKQKEESQMKKNEVQERKNQIIQGKYSDVEEKFRISSIRSQFQIEKKKLVERISKFQLWQLVWIKIIKQVNVLQTMHEKLEVKTKQKMICHQAKFIAIRAIADWMKHLRRLGPIPEKRVINLSCIVTNKFAQMLSSKCNKKAENIISNYLQQSSIIMDIKSKGVSLISRIINIQRQWRETKQKKKRFKELIVRQFQSKYNEYLYEIRLENRKQKDPFYQPKQLYINQKQQLKFILKYLFLIYSGTMYRPTISKQQISNIFYQLQFNKSDFKNKTSVLLSQVVQNYLMEHLRRYYELYETYRRSMKALQLMNEETKKNYSISVAMQKPLFFRLPKDYQLKQMVKEYAELKQLII